MKNLENYGVQEMNSVELKNIDGGCWEYCTPFGQMPEAPYSTSTTSNAAQAAGQAIYNVGAFLWNALGGNL